MGSDREKCREEAKFDEEGQMKRNKVRKWGGTKINYEREGRKDKRGGRGEV